MITQSAQYGYYENFEFYPSVKLKSTTQNFFNDLFSNRSCLILVNEKKVLLQQIFKNLMMEVSPKMDTKWSYLDSLCAGSFTNYMSPTFIEPESVLMILTKKHNQKELRILSELKKTRIKVYVIVLGMEYYAESFKIIKIDKITPLYWFMYTFLNMFNSYTYRQFSDRFIFSRTRVNFSEVLTLSNKPSPKN